MELVTPGIGLIVWTSLAFLIAWFILGKFAWKPILKALGDRERSIEEALESAERAKREMDEDIKYEITFRVQSKSIT